MSRPAAKPRGVTLTAISPGVLKQLAEFIARVTVGARPTIAIAERFTKVSADGKLLPKSAKEWKGVYEAATGLVWGRRLLPGSDTWKASVAKANAATLCDAPARAPTVRERFCLSDFTRLSPALDTEYFDPSEKDQWEWTSTEAAPSGCAWFVYLGGGYSYRLGQGGHDHVRAVRAGQFFKIGSGTAARGVQP